MALLTGTYQLSAKSDIKITGHTNVSDFVCHCRDHFPAQRFILKKPEKGEYQTTFHTTKLLIPVRSLDCGNRLMNMQLRKTLNAREHPEIIIEFLKIRWEEIEKIWEAASAAHLEASIRICINGVQNDYRITISGHKSGTNRYRCSGKKILQMTDFNITPPSALLGRVKVKDRISIELDLELEVFLNDA